MNLSEQIRNIQKLDSRRVAGGIYGKIVNYPNTLRLLKKYNMMPAYAIIDGSTGYDVINGLAFVVPSYSIESVAIVESKLISLSNELFELLKQKNIDAFEVTSRVTEAERKAADYLGNLLILVNLRRDAELGIPDANKHDVFMETLEVMPPEAYIVKKSSYSYDRNASRKLKESVR